LWTAITVLVERNVHRLCVLKDNGAIEVISSFYILNILHHGLISLSDIMNFLVVNVADMSAENLHYHSRFSQHSRHSSLGILPEGLESLVFLKNVRRTEYEKNILLRNQEIEAP
uniref:Peptidase_M1 domain-containing protein n=1 Tax=Brugia timori TaxID=42155 RepID=A0A0R3QWA5_9BILA